MAEHTAYLFAVPQAARLGSLAGIKSDLENVVQYCDRMIERYCGDHLKKSPFHIVGFTTPLDFLIGKRSPPRRALHTQGALLPEFVALSTPRILARQTTT